MLPKQILVNDNLRKAI